MMEAVRSSARRARAVFNGSPARSEGTRRVDSVAPPWRSVGPIWERFPGLPTMLKGDELQLLYWLARDHYAGEGTIVDAGPFLGGSTVALCAGLADHPRVPNKDGAVHSYDQFLYDPFYAPWVASLGEQLTDGQSFAHLWRRVTQPFAQHIVLHEGDVIETARGEGPIEILFLDICKSWEINAAVLRCFFSRLLPGRSMVVQQDYLHFYEYWLVLAMDLLKPCFEYVGRVEDGSSVLWRCVLPVPQELLHVDLRALPKARKAAAFEAEVTRSEGWQQVEVLVAYARLLLGEEHDEAGAKAVFDRIDPAYYEHPISSAAMQWIPRHFLAR
jgi:hypothetical protein